MAAHRYWRLVGFAVAGAGVLDLSEVQWYAAGVRVGEAVVPTCPFEPASGSLAALVDGLTAGVVSWGSDQSRQPGFALVWDFGPAGLDIDAVRLGSGSDSSRFPEQFTVQYADAVGAWTNACLSIAPAFPGPAMLTPTQVVAIDPYYESVLLNLDFEGEDGATFFEDHSKAQRKATVFGAAAIATAKPKIGNSAGSFPGAGSYLRFDLPASEGLQTGDFTLECFLLTAQSAGAGGVLALGNGGADDLGNLQAVIYLVNGRLRAAATNQSTFIVIPDSAVVSDGAYHHVAFVRSGNSFSLFLDGVLSGSVSNPATLAFAPYIFIGSTGAAAAYWYNGLIDEVRVSKSARYLTNFTPPSATFSLVGRAPSRARLGNQSSDVFLGAAQPEGVASSHAQSIPFFDAYHGGLGIIYGTVKEKNTPANAPLRRKVWLMDERSGLVIRETWSDAATGAYEFRGIKQGMPCTVLAYDHAHNYRAFAGDNLLPDPMP